MSLLSLLRRFQRDESGVVTVEFVIIFPIFVLLFLMTFESGMVSLRHFALERGVDLAVRDVRIGRMAVPSRDLLRAQICEYAGLLPDCENQLQVEMVRRSVRNWVNVPATVQCIDRGAAVQPVVQFTNGGNNELIFLRACIRLDPVMPTTGLGRTIVERNAGGAAGGSYALVSTSGFVVEPFQASP
ncbi:MULTISPECIES: TadE/TadG family type IV pilus assembly protein [unclassified Yoonia]|uniref:TadE/TadG family type IV pilus assembly protein n=1 Tax=unclassified Yoonia TaxID=2629118 RepID=UPI002AFFF710|nr:MULTISPECIES: TadE/TadG family type IV pilus assembly protein [unclassified Yoonia]